MNEPITLAPEQMAHLESVMESAIRAEVKAMLREISSPFRDRAGAGAFLQVTPASIDAYRRQGRLTPKYVGARPVYAVAELIKFPTKNPTHEPDYEPAA